MLQITVSLDSLSVEQREAVASFIRSYPTAQSEPAEVEEFATIPPFTVAEDEEPETPSPSPSPEEVFAADFMNGTSNTPGLLNVSGPVLVAPATPPPPPPAPATAGVTLDKHGLPWDARIHTSTKALNADGSWRRKRGIDDATVTHVEGELRALMSIPAAAPSPMAVLETLPPGPPAPVAAFPPLPPPPAAPIPPASASTTFLEVVMRASELIALKKITMEQVNTVVSSLGVASLSLLASRPDLVPQVMNAINGLVAAA